MSEVRGSPKARRPIAVDLYAGAGGLSLGMEQAGFDVVGAVEVDPVHALTHQFNFPRCAVSCRDVADFTRDDLLSLARRGWEQHNHGQPFPGVIDAVVGGPPCQGFSVGGVRRVGDDRNLQLLQFVRIIEDVRPRVFLLENVAGLLEGRFDPIREEALERLWAAGYAIVGEAQHVNAMNYGVPQSRKRMLIRGILKPGNLPELNPSVSAVTVQDAFEGLPVIASYGRLLTSAEALLKPEDGGRRMSAPGRYARTLSGLMDDPDDFGYPRIWDPAIITSSLRTTHERKTVQRFRRTIAGTVEPKSRLYRLSPSGVSRTLRAGTGTDGGSHTSPRPIHPIKPRVVTVREAARLHGYPDWFRFHVTNWHGHRQIGNSVPPPLARTAASSLLEGLGLSAWKPTERVALGDAAWLTLPRLEAKTVLSADDGSQS